MTYNYFTPKYFTPNYFKLLYSGGVGVAYISKYDLYINIGPEVEISHRIRPEVEIKDRIGPEIDIGSIIVRGI